MNREDIFSKRYLGDIDSKEMIKLYQENVESIHERNIRAKYAEFRDKQDEQNIIEVTNDDSEVKALCQMTNIERFTHFKMNKEEYDLVQPSFTISDIGNNYAKFIFKKKQFNKSIINVIYEEIKEFNQVWKENTKINADVYVLTLFDVHLGKTATTFNSTEKATQETELKKLQSIFNQTYSLLPEGTELVLPIGQDLFNSDNAQRGTTKGTLQFNDQTPKIWKKSLVMFNKFIEKLVKKNIKVNILYTKGNHDEMTAWYFYLAIEQCFSKCSLVKALSNNMRNRQYYGKNKYSCVFTHGNKSDLKDIDRLFALEESEMWAKSIFRECFSGHTHGLKVKEQFGFVTNTANSLSATDEWHSENGYVGNRKMCELHCINSRKGQKLIIHNLFV